MRKFCTFRRFSSERTICLKELHPNMKNNSASHTGTARPVVAKWKVVVENCNFSQRSIETEFYLSVTYLVIGLSVIQTGSQVDPGKL